MDWLWERCIYTLPMKRGHSVTVNFVALSFLYCFVSFHMCVDDTLLLLKTWWQNPAFQMTNSRKCELDVAGLLYMGDESFANKDGGMLIKSWGAFRQSVGSMNTFMQADTDCPPMQDMWKTSVDAIHTQQLQCVAQSHQLSGAVHLIFSVSLKEVLEETLSLLWFPNLSQLRLSQFYGTFHTQYQFSVFHNLVKANCQYCMIK